MKPKCSLCKTIEYISRMSEGGEITETANTTFTEDSVLGTICGFCVGQYSTIVAKAKALKARGIFPENKGQVGTTKRYSYGV